MEGGLHRTARRSDSGASYSTRHLSPVAAEEVPVSFSEEELLHSLEVEWGKPAPRARKRSWISTLPRQYFPLVYCALHAFMFVCFLRLNTLGITLSDLGTAGTTGVAMFIVTSVVFLYLTQSDPGFLRSKREHSRGDPGVGGVLSGDVAVAAGRVEQTFCRVCNLLQPIRTHHCAHCNRCVHTFDHHCWWVGRCIGGKNKPEFLLFLFAQTLLTGYTLALFVASAYSGYTKGEVGLVSARMGALIMFCGVCVVVQVWAMRLVLFHVRLILRNQTSVEVLRTTSCNYMNQLLAEQFMQMPRCVKGFCPFSRGVLSNLLVTFWYRPVEWEPPMRQPSRRHCGGEGCGGNEGGHSHEDNLP